MFKEFRNFAMRGNVIDLAVGVIVGTAFSKIVTSLVNDVLMPIFGLLMGKVNFSALALTIGNSTINYGLFLQSVIDFIIVAFCIFMTIKQLGRFRKKEPPPPAIPAEIKLLTEIRDLLQNTSKK